MKKYISTLLLLTYLVLFGFVTKSEAAPRCPMEKPNHKPEIFQIDTTRTSATLYFTPVNNAVTEYRIVYGYAKGQDDFGVSYPMGYYDGVLSYTINDLNPDTRYYFKVTAVNGCRYGYWSNTMSARTGWDFKSYYRYKEAVADEGLEPPTSAM